MKPSPRKLPEPEVPAPTPDQQSGTAEEASWQNRSTTATDRPRPEGRPPSRSRSPHRWDDSLRGNQELGGSGAPSWRHAGEDDADYESAVAGAGDSRDDPVAPTSCRKPVHHERAEPTFSSAGSGMGLAKTAANSGTPVELSFHQPQSYAFLLQTPSACHRAVRVNLERDPSTPSA